MIKQLKASELILLLRQRIKDHGDLIVYLPNDKEVINVTVDRDNGEENTLTIESINHAVYNT